MSSPDESQPPQASSVSQTPPGVAVKPSQPQLIWGSEHFKAQVSDALPPRWMGSSPSETMGAYTAQASQEMQQQAALSSQSSTWGSEQFREQMGGSRPPRMDSTRSAVRINTPPGAFPQQQMQSVWSSEPFRQEASRSQPPWMDLSHPTMRVSPNMPVVAQSTKRGLVWTSEEFEGQASGYDTWIDPPVPGMRTKKARHDPALGMSQTQPILGGSRYMPVVSQSTWGPESFRERVSGLQAPWMDSSRSGKIANAAPPNLAPSVNQTKPVWKEYEIHPLAPPTALGTKRFREQISGSRTSRVDSSPSGMLTSKTPTSLPQRNPPNLERDTENPSTLSYISFAANTASHPKGPELLPYNYSALDRPVETRVLQLLPGGPDDPMEVELQRTSLAAKGEYSAMSYAWGSKAQSETITCGGKYITIPANLHNALRRLRHESEPRKLWADAACINQSDEAEKSQQVSFMRLIFKHAVKVLIWLGPDDTDSAKPVFELINRIFEKDFQAVPPPDDHVWKRMSILFNTQWFWRLWCLQEVALAPTADVMWGAETIPWERLGFAAAWIRAVPAPTLRLEAMSGIYNACLMYSLSYGSEEQEPVSFLQLLTLCRQFISSDARDKVYGILGIPTTDSNPDCGDLFLQPDYTKTVLETYLECAIKIIQQSGSLRILSYVQHAEQQYTERPTESTRDTTQSLSLVVQDSNNQKICRQTIDATDGLPSWVPRWGQYFARTLAPPETATKTFSACAGLGDIRPQIEGTSLIISGIEFSSIRHSSETMGEHDMWGKFFLREHFSAFEKGYLDGPDLLEVLSLTLTAGKDWYGSLTREPKQHVADFLTFMSGAFKFSDEGAAFAKFTNPPSDLQAWLLSPQNRAFPGLVGDASHFEEALRTACSERKMFITDNGCLGLGPQAMRDNDIVCILSGSIVPLVLRPSGDTYKLVGEVYIHGIMFGEACAEEKALRSFILT